MAGEAFRLVIPQDMLNKLQAADDKLKSLGNTSENTRNRVTQAFGKMTGGVQAFINKLNEAQQRLDNLSNFKGANINLGNVVTRDSVANIDKLIEAINQLSQKGQAKITINGIDATANQAVVAVDSINKLIDTLVKLQQMGGQNFTATTNLLGKETLKQMNSEARKMSKTIDKLDEATQRYASTAGNLSDKIRQAREAQRQFNEEAKRAAQTNVGDLMSGRGKATTLNELKAYANQLKTTMANLDPKSKEWQNLNRILQETNKDIQRINESMGAVRKTQSNLMNHAQQLRRALALVFSVSQITGYINKMIQVRGEFELQQRSLQAILQNKDEADKLWQQTVDLAVRSPFRVKELVSYTKQLAAYRVETEKLHETTKMLSDVSAGLGVDMQRLILAFGQVKAANYLRGTELRQFSEAGINILGELAKYFTELEGRAVSVGEVFERVSKRMVAFSDVEEIFKRVTSEGGVFYRMQEIQSETVKGLISNLYDQVDLMLNEMGESNDGYIKGAIGLVKSLVENWKYVAEAIKIAGAAWLVYKVQAQLAHEKNMLLARDFGILTDASQKQLKFTQLLALSWKRVTLAVKTFTKALIANPIILAITAALYAATKLYSAWSKYQEQLEEITKQYKELRKEVTDISVKFTYASNIEEQKKELSKLIGVAKDKYNLNVDIDVKGLDEQEVSEKFNNLRNEILNTMAFTEQMSKAIVESDAWYKWGDDIYGAFEKFSKSAQEYSNVIRNNNNAIVEFLTETGRFDDVAKEFFAERGEYVKNETELEYIERLTLAYKLYYKEIVRGGKIIGANGLIQRPTEEVEALRKAASEYVKAKEDAVKEFDEFAKDFNIPSILTEENKTAYVKTAIDQQGFDDFTREMWYKLANQRFSVNITPKAVAPTELEDWAVRVTDAIKEVNAKIKKENPNIEDNQLFPLPQIGQTREQYLNLAKARLDIAKATYNEEQKIIDDSTVKQTEALAPYAEAVEKILNLSGDDGRDIFADQIRVIKEIYQAYKDLGKTLDDIGAKEGAMQKFGNAFKEAFDKTPKEMGFDLFSEEGVKKAYDYLIKNAPNAKKKIQAELAKGEIVLETKVRLQQEEDKEFADQIADMFSGYELSLELQKLNIPPDLANQLFGVETFDLSQIRERLEKEIADAEMAGGREDFVKELADYLVKVAKAEKKEREELLTKFAEILVLSEDEIDAVVNKTGQKVDFAKKLFSKNALNAEQYLTLIKHLTEEANEDISKINLEKFKDSSLYIASIGNLASYSRDQLRDMVKEMKKLISESGRAMSVEELKAYMEAMGKMEKQLEDTKIPFFSNSYFGKVKELLDLQKEQADYQKQKEGLEQQRSDIEANIQHFKKMLDASQKAGDSLDQAFAQQNLDHSVQQLSNVNSQIQGVEVNLENVGGKIQNITGGTMGVIAIIDMIVKGIYQAIEAIEEAFYKVKNIADSFGVETEEGVWSKWEASMNAISNHNQNVMNAWERLKSGDGLGSTVSSLAAISDLIADINRILDVDQQNKIEESRKAIERLEKSYEKVNKRLQDAYDLTNYEGLYTESAQNLEERIKASEAIIAAEEAKKDTDKDAINAEKENIEALREELKELSEQRLDDYGGFGSEANKKSAAEAFVDAWLQAYKETGDGLSGLNEQFDEFYENFVKKQLLLQGTSKYLDAFFNQFDDKINSLAKSGATKEQIANVVNEIKETWDGTSSNLDAFLSSLAEAFKISEMLGTTELAGLQAGISGITEDQADILASYWNSVRFYTADTNAKFTDLITRLFDSEGSSNPMLAELRAQTAFIKEIRDVLGSVVGLGGTTHSGAFLKVAIG